MNMLIEGVSLGRNVLTLEIYHGDFRGYCSNFKVMMNVLGEGMKINDDKSPVLFIC